jgi:hypothetical protein
VTKSGAGDQAVEKFSEYIRNQVLADSLTLVDSLENGEEVELDGASISVSIVKA